MVEMYEAVEFIAVKELLLLLLPGTARADSGLTIRTEEKPA
jgi:hypothetical protein